MQKSTVYIRQTVTANRIVDLRTDLLQFFFYGGRAKDTLHKTKKYKV